MSIGEAPKVMHRSLTFISDHLTFEAGRQFVLIDTPGLNDGGHNDTHNISVMADELKNTDINVFLLGPVLMSDHYLAY